MARVPVLTVSSVPLSCGVRSKLVHAGVNPDPISGAILTPIFQSTTYIQDSIEEYLDKGFSYARTGNPTVKVLENKIAELESGAGAACFGTGMAATISVVSGTMQAGDHCVITNCSYGGTNRACRTMFTDMGMEFDFIDFTDIANIEAHIKPNTKLIFSETPANPTVIPFPSRPPIASAVHGSALRRIQPFLWRSVPPQPQPHPSSPLLTSPHPAPAYPTPPIPHPHPYPIHRSSH